MSFTAEDLNVQYPNQKKKNRIIKIGQEFMKI